MKTELTDYDIYPKIIPSDTRARIHIRPLGDHAAFQGNSKYTVMIVAMNETNLNDPEHPYTEYEVSPFNGTLQVEHPFGSEGQYALIIRPGKGYVEPGSERPQIPHQTRPWPLELRVYAVDPDLYKLRPYRGDMHCHTYYSDGKESPAVVAANYRKAGFDFLAITDHQIIEPSLEAIEVYRDAPIDLKILPGEEVHPPANNSHYVHIGGDYSINALFRRETERYKREVREIAEGLRIPPDINPQEYASALWVCREIKKAQGLSVIAHPSWIQNFAYHNTAKMFAYMLETMPFDALELSAGQSREENQMQVSFWQQKRGEGHGVNIVGSSDSHGTVNSLWFNLSKMVVLAESCEREHLFDAVRKGRVVVLEQYAGEELPRLYGIYRYVAFVSFLLDEYFPLHDELCFEEGRLMKEFVCGDQNALALLKAVKGRCTALLEKCLGLK
jgi:hypothetical protein